MLEILQYSTFLLLLYVLGTWGIGAVLGIFLRRFDSADLPQGLASAGKWIGYLERSLYLSFLLLNQISFVGFILTIKAIYRFGDIQGENTVKMRLSEYFIIGTMASLLATLALYQLYLLLPVNH